MAACDAHAVAAPRPLGDHAQARTWWPAVIYTPRLAVRSSHIGCRFPDAQDPRRTTLAVRRVAVLIDLRSSAARNPQLAKSSALAVRRISVVARVPCLACTALGRRTRTTQIAGGGARSRVLLYCGSYPPLALLAAQGRPDVCDCVSCAPMRITLFTGTALCREKSRCRTHAGAFKRVILLVVKS